MASTNFRPLHDRVVVRRVESEAKTKGGIIIPDTARKSRRKAKSSPSAPARAMSPARLSHSTSRLATASCSASGPAPKSRSTAKTF